MKYTRELIIELPRKKVLELFVNPDNLYKWQPTLKSFEHISGEPGAEGAVHHLTYKGKRNVAPMQAGIGKDLKVIGTIYKVNLPEEISFLYEVNGIENWYSNHFYEEGSTSTRWITESEFRYSGSMKLFGFFIKRTILKQTSKRMQMFKKFAENS